MYKIKTDTESRSRCGGTNEQINLLSELHENSFTLRLISSPFTNRSVLGHTPYNAKSLEERLIRYVLEMHLKVNIWYHGSNTASFSNCFIQHASQTHSYKHFFLQLSAFCLTFTQIHTPMKALQSNSGSVSCPRISGMQTEPPAFLLAQDLLYVLSHSRLFSTA